MKRKILLISLALVLIGGLLTVGCSAPAPTPAPGGSQPATTVTVTATAPAKAVVAQTLVLASWNPPPSAPAQAENYFAKELEQRSGGRIKVQLNQGSSMGKPPEHYNLAVTGVSDVSDACLIYTPGAFPMAEVWEYPIGPAPTITYARAYWELYNMKYFDNDFKDVKLIYVGVNGPYQIMTATKQVKSLADLAGMKLRVGGVQAEVLKTMGATPVTMPATDVFDAMSKGVVDGSFFNWGAMLPFGIAPATKFVAEVGITCSEHAVVMNKAYYEKLPEDIKAILADIGQRSSISMGLEFAKEDEHAKSDVYKGATNQFSAEEVAKLDQAVAPVWQKWIADGNAKGLPRAKMLTDLYNILKRFGVEKPMYGYTP